MTQGRRAAHPITIEGEYEVLSETKRPLTPHEWREYKLRLKARRDAEVQAQYAGGLGGLGGYHQQSFTDFLHRRRRR